MEELGHIILFFILKATWVHLLLHWVIENILIHIKAYFHMIYWMCSNKIIFLLFLVLILQVKLWMKFIALILCVAINVAITKMIYSFLALMSILYCIIFLFSCLLLPLHGSYFLVFFLFWKTWLPFLLAYVF